MKTLEEMTPAEKNLSKMASVVLVLGLLITFTTFAVSCLIWEGTYSGAEVQGFNWYGIPNLLLVLLVTLISWSVLSVFVEIAINVRKMSAIEPMSWSKDFALKITINHKEEAKEILYKEILSSEIFSELMNTSDAKEDNVQNVIKKINKEYEVYLNAIEESSFNINYGNKIYNVFK